MVLYLLRHAHADPDSPTGRDEDRPLSIRGRNQAAALAGLFLGGEPPVSVRPEFIASSPAARARATAEPIARALGMPLRFEPALGLDAGRRELEGFIADLDAAAALLVGHNPQLSSLVRHACNSAGLQTGELVVLHLDPSGKAREAGRFHAD
jgi:phosphohistidine phosphatase